MEWLKELVAILPDIILYIVSGYICAFAFSFISIRKKVEDINGIIILSLVVGYTLNAVLSAFIIVEDFVAVYFLFSAIIGVIAGFLFRSRILNIILKKLHINRTINMNIWHDIVDSKNPMWIRAVNRGEGYIILGILVLVEEFERYPQIVLQQYEVFDINSGDLYDHKEDARRQIVIKTENFDEIEIVYDEDSKMYRKIDIGAYNNEQLDC